MGQSDAIPLPEEVRTIGIAGWGRMGASIGEHFLRHGRDVVGYDPAEAAQEAMRSAGARAAADLCELGAASDFIMVIVVDDEQVKQAILGERGIVEGARPGTVVGICASVKPETCVEVAAEAARDGVNVIDMALVGGERGAEDASLKLMCGGPEQALDVCRGVLADIASDVCRIGDIGTGQVAKSVNNIMLWACIRADLEALRLAQRLGVAPNQLRVFMAIGSGANRPLAEWGMHRLRWPKKDLEVALELAAQVGLEMPLVEELANLMGQTSVEDLHAVR